MLGGVAAAYIVDRGVLLVAVVSGTICLAAGFLAARRAPVDGGWVPRLERWWAGGSAADADAPAAHASRGPMAPLVQLAPAAAPAERGTAGVPQLQPSVVSTAPAAVPAAIQSAEGAEHLTPVEFHLGRELPAAPREILAELAATGGLSGAVADLAAEADVIAHTYTVGVALALGGEGERYLIVLSGPPGSGRGRVGRAIGPLLHSLGALGTGDTAVVPAGALIDSWRRRGWSAVEDLFWNGYPCGLGDGGGVLLVEGAGALAGPGDSVASISRPAEGPVVLDALLEHLRREAAAGSSRCLLILSDEPDRVVELLRREGVRAVLRRRIDLLAPDVDALEEIALAAIARAGSTTDAAGQAALRDALEALHEGDLLGSHDARLLIHLAVAARGTRQAPTREFVGPEELRLLTAEDIVAGAEQLRQQEAAQ
ncbi:MAG: hypothetical protein E6G56_15500 [Actinobacteria bacterium]|nr:MAG: hypothetical protein E6G56_15500 [Actinomycetota bacterium]